MKITKENFFEKFDLVKQSIHEAHFISFDFEMSGIMNGPDFEISKFDSPEFRYFKMSQVVRKFDLIQLGLTCFIWRDGEYFARPFSFHLFRNSPLKFLDHKENFFHFEQNSHPDCLRFLVDNGFDFNKLYKDGIHFNKIANKERIRKFIENYYNEGIVNYQHFHHLSLKNQLDLKDIIFKIVEFLNGKDRNKSKKLQIKVDSEILMKYIISTSWKSYLGFANFSITKDKKEKNMLNIEKSKAILDDENFKSKFISLENFAQNFSYNDVNFPKYKQNFPENKSIDDLILEELGASLLIEQIIQAKKPLCAHHMNYDLLFLYDKFIEDLPLTWIEFIDKFSNLFPNIYDTRVLASCYNKTVFNKFGLKNLEEGCVKLKLDSIVKIAFENEFSLTDDSNVFHDALYDSFVTGKILIYLNVLYREMLNSQALDFGVWENLNNKVFFSLDPPTNLSSLNKGCYFDEVELFKNQFKDVFIVKFKYDLHLEEILNVVQADEIDMNISRISKFSLFIQFISDNMDDNNNKNNDRHIDNLKQNKLIEFVIKYDELMIITKESNNYFNILY